MYYYVEMKHMTEISNYLGYGQGCVYSTRPKLRFTACPVYQNMTFPHTSYTYLAEDRAKFYANK